MDKALYELACGGDDESFVNGCAMVQEVLTREQPLIGIAFLDDSLYMSENLAGATVPMFKSHFANVGRWFLNN